MYMYLGFKKLKQFSELENYEILSKSTNGTHVCN